MKFFIDTANINEIKEAASLPLVAPALGKISIQAVPGNCSVKINGIDAEAPPIRNKDIVVGSHTIVFEWPGGETPPGTEPASEHNTPRGAAPGAR